MNSQQEQVIDLNNVQELFINFLQNYRENQDLAGQDDIEGEGVYMQILRDTVNSDRQTLGVDLEHLREFNLKLYDFIVHNYYHVEVHLRKGLQNLIKKVELENGEPIQETNTDQKEYWLSFFNLTMVEGIRQLGADQVGILKSFSATVTRTSDVKPELYLGVFQCGECQAQTPKIAQEFKFTEPVICVNPTCCNRKNWILSRSESIFVDWQKAKVQENPGQFPAGSLPRQMEVIVRGDMCERARPGDRVVFTGCVIVVPDVQALTAPGERLKMTQVRGENAFANMEGVTGLKELGVRELNYRLSFLAQCIQREGGQMDSLQEETEAKMDSDEVWDSFDDQEKEIIQAMQSDPQIYSKLAKSLAPQVYGNDDIKKALLLMLLGGVHKQTKEGMKLRGDINMIIVGDPACGKSQILKFVADFMPRTVYTSGKSSSAAGLTATVAKDQESGEFCIEAGALMLADNGICCIDEFDKMDERDQVAIHEAMEQQTISISKAGIHAKLNARTPVLAAANPIGGKYDKSKQLRYNVNLTAPILSRFDLLYVMVDEPDEIRDLNVALHVCKLHMGTNLEDTEALAPPYSQTELQRYFRYAKSINPQLSEEAQKLLVKNFQQLRLEDASPGSQSAYRITVRQLEALVRLSEALARVVLSDKVKEVHVKEATRLLKNSIIGLEQPDILLNTDDDLLDFDRLNLHDEEVEAGNQNQQNQQEEADDKENRAPAGSSGDVQKDGDQPGQSEGPVKLTQRKLSYIKRLLFCKLQEVEKAEQEQTAADDAHLVADVGLTQEELIKFYFAEQVKRAQMQDSELDSEFKIVSAAIQYLIDKDGCLLVIQTPDRNEGEEDLAFKQRSKMQRVLVANPNYVIDS